jgi:hypothetical protein
VIIQAPTQDHTGAILGAAVGGGVGVLLLIGLAARYRAVSIQLNTMQRVKSWKHGPETEINHNPLVTNTKTTDVFKVRKSKFEVIPV